MAPGFVRVGIAKYTKAISYMGTKDMGHQIEGLSHRNGGQSVRDVVP